jgi:MFS family permease
VYFESLEEPDFFWVWISRLLYYMGISVQVFIQYFIRDVIGLASAEAKQKTAIVSLVMLACASLVAVPCGMLSDRVGRRPLIYISSVLMAITYCGWALSTEMWQILAWSALFGLANGCFISVEFAIGCDTLPDKNDHAAQALGVWGIAGFLGSTLGPVISGPLLFLVGHTDEPDTYSHQGYVALLAVGALLVLSSSLALWNMGRLHNGTDIKTSRPDIDGWRQI